jgi:hypothetical protein
MYETIDLYRLLCAFVTSTLLCLSLLLAFLRVPVSAGWQSLRKAKGISRQALNDYFSTVLQVPFRSWRIEQRIAEAY